MKFDKLLGDASRARAREEIIEEVPTLNPSTATDDGSVNWEALDRALKRSTAAIP